MKRSEINEHTARCREILRDVISHHIATRQWPFYKMKSGRSKRNYLKNPTNIPDIPHVD
jgi:hypothetical protein